MGTFTPFCSVYIFINCLRFLVVVGSCFQPVITVHALMEEPVMKKAEETTAVNVEVAGLENGVKF